MPKSANMWRYQVEGPSIVLESRCASLAEARSNMKQFGGQIGEYRICRYLMPGGDHYSLIEKWMRSKTGKWLLAYGV